MTKPRKCRCTQRIFRSETSLCAQWLAKDPSFLHADNEDSDQTGRTCHLVGFVMRRYSPDIHSDIHVYIIVHVINQTL